MAVPVCTPSSRRLSRLVGAALLLGTLALTACDSTGGEETTGPPLVPLAVGNYWRYERDYLGGAIRDSFEASITGEITFRDRGTMRRAFAEHFRHIRDGSPPEFTFLRGNAEGGYYVFGGLARTDTLLTSLLNYRYPAKVGEKWPLVRLSFSNERREFYRRDPLTMQLVAKDEPFVTPAGTFRCHVYKFSFKPSDDVLEEWDVYEYYAPGVGRVGEVVRGQMDDRVINKLTLYDYHLNGSSPQ